LTDFIPCFFIFLFKDPGEKHLHHHKMCSLF